MSKKRNAKRQAFQQAQAIMRKGAAIEKLPANAGMVIPGLSLDLEGIAAAEAVLIGAGYSGKQANVAINNIVKDMKDLAEGRYKKNPLMRREVRESSGIHRHSLSGLMGAVYL